jgi:hypothetical protein
MKCPIIAIAAAAFALTGCTSIGALFAAKDGQPSPIELANAYVPAASPVPFDFCARVAANARAEALRAGFDAATQTRIGQQNARQCQSFAPQQQVALAY